MLRLLFGTINSYGATPNAFGGIVKIEVPGDSHRHFPAEILRREAECFAQSEQGQRESQPRSK
jgi:hypothetical protein